MEPQVRTRYELNWLKCYRPLIPLCRGENLQKKCLCRSYRLSHVLSSSVPRKKSLKLRFFGFHIDGAMTRGASKEGVGL